MSIPLTTSDCSQITELRQAVGRGDDVRFVKSSCRQKMVGGDVHVDAFDELYAFWFAC